MDSSCGRRGEAKNETEPENDKTESLPREKLPVPDKIGRENFPKADGRIRAALGLGWTKNY